MMSCERENLIRQQRLDKVLQEEIHQLSQHTSKVGSIEAFAQHMDVQRSTWTRRFEIGMKRSSARRRFDTAIGKRKVLDHFWKSVKRQEVHRDDAQSCHSFV